MSHFDKDKFGKENDRMNTTSKSKGIKTFVRKYSLK